MFPSISEVDTYAFRKDLNALKQKVKTVRSGVFFFFFFLMNRIGLILHL